MEKAVIGKEIMEEDMMEEEIMEEDMIEEDMIEEEADSGRIKEKGGDFAENYMQLYFAANSVNESLARMAATAFMSELNPTLEQLEDVKTAVSEAVTNAIVHGCEENGETVEMECTYKGERLTIRVTDHGTGIADIEKAMQPFFTTRPDMERSGMGFVFMDAFMDELTVESEPGKGTSVFMVKYVRGQRNG